MSNTARGSIVPMMPWWMSTNATATRNGTQSSYRVRTTITTKKLKCISIRPPEISTSAADPVSRPIDADTERHLRDTSLHQARPANATIATISGM